MKSKRKALLLALSTALVAVLSIFGTLAYLDDSETVKNTLTVGAVGLKLYETDVNTDGTKASDRKVQENEYELLPGRTYIKDPTVTVDKGSVEAYIRMVVEVRNAGQLKAALPDSKYYADLDQDGNTDDFVLQLLLDDSWNDDEWHFAGYTESGTTGIYEFRYDTTVDASEAADDVQLNPLFTRIKVPGEIDNDQLANLAEVEIVVNAHAIQAAGFDDADAAWAAFAEQHK